MPQPTAIGISATWTTLAGSHGKRNNTITTTSSRGKTGKIKLLRAFKLYLMIHYQSPCSQPEKVNGESKSSSTSESGDSDNMRISSCSDRSSNSNGSRKSDNHSPAVVTTTVTSRNSHPFWLHFKGRKSVSGKTSIVAPIFIFTILMSLPKHFVFEFFSKAVK